MISFRIAGVYRTQAIDSVGGKMVVRDHEEVARLFLRMLTRRPTAHSPPRAI